MSDNLAKKLPTESPLIESPQFNTILTRVVIRSLCPYLKCEVMFTQAKSDKLPTFYAWNEQVFTGDIQGKFALGVGEHTLRVLAKTFSVKNKNGKFDLGLTQAKLFNLISTELARQLGDDAFDVEFSGKQVFNQNYEVAPPSGPYTLCRIDTKYGAFTLFLSLEEASAKLIDEQFAQAAVGGRRKIRVSAEQLDALFERLKTIEELENNLLIGPKIRREMRGEIKRMKRIVHRMKTEPVDLLFLPTKKIVTEIAKQQGKQVNLLNYGSPVHLDKVLLNHLYAPILHLVRNAVDHGIEEPAEREKMGKAASGTVKCISSFSEKGLKILISDDGRGFNFQKIREQAIAKGILTSDEATQALSNELYPLLFKEKFSTRSHPDAISGSGLGLNIVQKEVHILGGQVRVLSTSHKGTALEIFVPLTPDLGVIEPKRLSITPESKQADERGALLEELASSLERMDRLIEALKAERKSAVAYEAYRLLHSIRGIAGFMRWNRVVLFSHQFEDLLKAIADEKVKLTDHMVSLVEEAAGKLQKLCDTSRVDPNVPQTEVKSLEGNILRALWTTTQEEEKSNFSLAKAQKKSVFSLTEHLFAKHQVEYSRESDFDKVFKQPYAGLIQFEGDRQGYAAILMPEKSLLNVFHPLVTGKQKSPSLAKGGSLHSQLETLGEFAYLMGRELIEGVEKEIAVHFGAPVSYFGNHEFFPLIGTPTYCYAGQLQGHPFYLIGDFEEPEDIQKSEGPQKVVPFLPSLILKEASQKLEKTLSKSGLKTELQDRSENWDLLGFNDGVGVAFKCTGRVEQLLSIHFEKKLIQTLINKQKGAKNKTGVIRMVQEIAKLLRTHLNTQLKKNNFQVTLSTPTFYLGNLTLPQTLTVTGRNQIVGNTASGRFEIQLL